MIAVLGASGQVGSALTRQLSESCLPVTRRQLDLTDLGAIRPWLATTAPEAVVNCAAYTAVDSAESDAVVARMVNALAVEELARACVEQGVRFATFSTDYVFDGEKSTAYVESDTPKPLNVYGRTKLEGELRAQEADPDALIIRSSWVLSGTHQNFVSKMMQLISRGSVAVVSDQRGHPTLADDLAAATVRVLDTGATGILHLANQGTATWFDLAKEIAEIGGLDPEAVTPCSSADYPSPTKRPHNSVLDSERLPDIGITPLPHYRPGLERAVGKILDRAGQRSPE